MKHNIRYGIYSLWLCMMLLSCTEEDAVSDTKQVQSISLCMGHAEAFTRQGLDIVQAESQPFRGLTDLVLLAFTNNREVQKGDLPVLEPYTSSSVSRIVDRKYYYHLNDCPLLWGTSNVLIYGRAPRQGNNNSVNGILTTTLSNQSTPNNISFQLQSIRGNIDVHDDAKDLADYLTAIATTTGWSTTQDAAMKSLYTNFIYANGNMLIGGAAGYVKAYVDALEEQLGTDALSIAIKERINASTKSCLDNGYPADLPAGTAALRWTGSGFEVRTEKTTLDNINGINRYTYPAELYYYVNSPLYTSDVEVTDDKYNTSSAWGSIMVNNYKGSRWVVPSTKSVAVEKPLQYGVARLNMTLRTISGTLRDANDDIVDYGNNAENLPLTGIIIGGQHTVGFDFKPINAEQSDVDARFIYDNEISASNNINTLVLQSYDGETVPVVLEFQNNTGNSFVGKNGIVYPGTKFYLIATLNPTDMGSGAYANRVFTQDYETQAIMRVTSLANAYVCIPDLLEPRLEIGVQVETQWVQSSTTTVKL